MQFLLSQLSFMDLTLIFTTLPKMAADLLLGDRDISYIGYRVQVFIYLMLGVAECILLNLLDFDHYLDICSLLRYPVFMTPRLCVEMAARSRPGDTSTYEKVILVSGIIFLLIPFGFILISYILICLTFLHVNNPKEKSKALAMCFSQFSVVNLYFGPAIIIHTTPGFSLPPEMDQHHFVFDVLGTPMLKPLIYSLRNKEVLRALRKVLNRGLDD
ncbi:olfactory receptor 2M4-like [Elephas maximus indicus]|uniref:olfactory receptor 2M4-like n=1 Tax=Elephas maximus indicus TaxID=99487 RepID=UPI002115DEAD|nr:olfactory receptor 2M4-like [Elephas maximus indicus]